MHQHDIGLTQCLLGDYDAGSYTLRDVIQSAKLYGLKTQELEAKMHLALMTYLNENRPEQLTEIRQLTLQAQQSEIAGAGSALWYLEAQEAIRNNQPETVHNSINQFMILAEKEESVWWQWHALELQIQLARLQNLPSLEFENASAALINKLKQSLPKELLREVHFTSAPIAVLE